MKIRRMGLAILAAVAMSSGVAQARIAPAGTRMELEISTNAQGETSLRLFAPIGAVCSAIVRYDGLPLLKLAARQVSPWGLIYWTWLGRALGGVATAVCTRDGKVQATSIRFAATTLAPPAISAPIGARIIARCAGRAGTDNDMAASPCTVKTAGAFNLVVSFAPLTPDLPAMLMGMLVDGPDAAQDQTPAVRIKRNGTAIKEQYHFGQIDCTRGCEVAFMQPYNIRWAILVTR